MVHSSWVQELAVGDDDDPALTAVVLDDQVPSSTGVTETFPAIADGSMGLTPPLLSKSQPATRIVSPPTNAVIATVLRMPISTRSGSVQRSVQLASQSRTVR
jgi:hypothetical protein